MMGPNAKPAKSGMFGAGKPDWVSAISAALSGALAARGNPAGMMGLQMLQQKRQQAMQEEQYGRRREDEFQDFIRKQGWLAANKTPEVPDIIERINALDSIQPGLGKTYAQNYAQNGGSPFGRLFTDPATGQQFAMPGQGQLPPIGSELDDPRKGGPTPSASGGFPPYRY